MRRTIHRSGLFSIALLLMLFQNCSPKGFEAESYVTPSTDSISNNGNDSVVMPVTSQNGPGSLPPPQVVTPTPTPIQPSPNQPSGETPVVSQPPTESWTLVNDFGGVEGHLSSDHSASFDSFFPYLKSMRGSDYLVAKGLYLQVPLHHFGKSIDVCFSASAAGCETAGKFKKYNLEFKPRLSPGYTAANIEDFYNQPQWLTSFGDFYLFVNLEGEKRSILVRHRVFFPKNNPDPEYFFLRASDNGPVPGSNVHSYFIAGRFDSVSYGFGCFAGATENYGSGWKSYSYDRFGAKSSPCYYRILNRDQSLADVISSHIKKWGDKPSLKISCQGETILHKKIYCGMSGGTPVLLQPPGKWFWQIGEQALVPYGDSLSITAKELGSASVKLISYNYSGTQVVSSNTIELTVKENPNLKGSPQNGTIGIKCDANVKVGSTGSCSVISWAAALTSQGDSWAWRVNDSRSPLAPSGQAHFQFVPMNAGAHQVFLEAVDDSGRVIKSNIVTVQVAP